MVWISTLALVWMGPVLITVFVDSIMEEWQFARQRKYTSWLWQGRLLGIELVICLIAWPFTVLLLTPVLLMRGFYKFVRWLSLYMQKRADKKMFHQNPTMWGPAVHDNCCGKHSVVGGKTEEI